MKKRLFTTLFGILFLFSLSFSSCNANQKMFGDVSGTNEKGSSYDLMIKNLENQILLLHQNQNASDKENQKEIDRLDRDIKAQVKALRTASDTTRPYLEADVNEMTEEIFAKRKTLSKLEMELEDLQEMPILTVQPPETDSQPFKDSVWQKNAQTVIGGQVQLERERKQIEEDYREATRAAYEAQRAALDDEYLNDILNINLKLDNQKQMHHPWVKQEELDAERAAWEEESLQLKRERGERQYQLKLAWDKQVQDYVNSVMAPKIAE
jgi:hypothetical protein